MPTYRLPRLQSLAALGLGSLLVLAGARAEPPAQPGEPMPPAESTVTLAFKQAAGQVQRFRGEIKGDMSVSPPGANGQSIPLNVVWQFATTERVVGVRQNMATLNLKMDSMVMNIDAGVAKIVYKLQNGKIVGTLNGEKPPPGSPGETSLAAMQKQLGPKTIRRSTRGTIAGQNIAGGSAMGGSTLSIVQLPTKPVQVGDSWETAQAVILDLPGGQAGGIPQGQRLVRLTHTLKSIETKKGRKYAMIESNGSTDVEGGAAVSLNQNILGTSRFDIERGALVSAQYALSINSSGGAGAGAAAGRVDANLEVTLNEVPVSSGGSSGTKPKPKAGKKR